MIHKYSNFILSIVILYLIYINFTDMSRLFYAGLIIFYIYIRGWNTLSVYTNKFNQPISYLVMNMIISIILVMKYLEPYIFESSTTFESITGLIISIFAGLLFWFFIGSFMAGLIDGLTDINVIDDMNNIDDPFNDPHAEKILNDD